MYLVIPAQAGIRKQVDKQYPDSGSPLRSARNDILIRFALIGPGPFRQNRKQVLVYSLKYRNPGSGPID